VAIFSGIYKPPFVIITIVILYHTGYGVAVIFNAAKAPFIPLFKGGNSSPLHKEGLGEIQ